MYLEKGAKTTKRIIGISAALFLIWSSVMPGYALAGRSDAGGGEFAHFDGGKIAMNIGISIGASVVGSALTSGLKNIGAQAMGKTTTGFTSAVGTSLKNSFKFEGLMAGYNTYLATSQASRTISIIGTRNNWDKSQTYLISSIASGLTGGLLNPSLGTGTGASSIGNFAFNMGKSAIIGGASGAASGAVITAIDGAKIDKGEDPGALAQIAGYGASIVTASALRTAMNPKTYTSSTRIIQRTTDPLTNTKQYKEVVSADMSGKPTDLQPVEMGFEKNLLDSRQVDLTQVAANDPRFSEVLGDVNPNLVTETGSAIDLRSEISTKVASMPKTAVQLAGLESNVRVDAMGKDTFAVTEKGPVSAGTVLGRIAEATFVTPFNGQNLPSLVGTSAGIYASSLLSKDDKYLKPLVQGVTAGVVSPIVGGVMNIAGLDPALYVGSGSNVVESRMKYAESLKSMARSEYSDNMAKAANTAGKALDEQRAKIINDPSLTQQQKAEKIDAAILEMNTELAKLSVGKDKFEMVTTKSPGTMKDDQFNKVLYGDNKDNTVTLGQINRDRAIKQENLRLTIAQENSADLSSALKVTGSSRGELFGNYVWSSMKSNVLEAAFSGGTSALLTKTLDLDNDKSDNALSQIMVSYAANMAGAIGRGIAWNLNYDSATREYAWQQRGDFEKPKQYNANPNSPQYDVLSDLASQSSYSQRLASYNNGLRVTGAEEFTTMRSDLVRNNDGSPKQENGKDVYVDVPVTMFRIGDDGQKPHILTTIAYSMEQANTEYTSRFLSFGRPLMKDVRGDTTGVNPEQVTPATFVNYLQNVQYLGSLGNAYGLQRVISYSATQAAVGAAGNSFMGAVSQIPGVGSMFNLQPQRAVMLVGHNAPYVNAKGETVETTYALPNLPFSIESIRYTNNAGMPGMETSLWGPFPNPFFTSRPKVGEGDYLRRRNIGSSGSLPPTRTP